MVIFSGYYIKTIFIQQNRVKSALFQEKKTPLSVIKVYIYLNGHRVALSTYL